MAVDPVKALRQQIADDIASFAKDPYGFVMYAFEWGQGALKDFKGPDVWQKDLLMKIRDGILTPNGAIQIAVASGHGVGKSAFISWIILWALATCDDTKGVVTANTATQLATKTWPELGKWHRLFIGRDSFEFTATSIFATDPDHSKTWRIDAIPWSGNNTEAFAGLHNQGKRIVLLFDEASAIDDKIWEVAEGALTDENTEIIWLAFGNPTRNTGRFKDCFDRLKHRWVTKQIDSRDVAITNKVQLQKMVDDWGEDSDACRVRVRGVFPKVGDRQFIGSDLVEAARGKHLRIDQYNFAPVIIACDPAWYGGDELDIVLRQGLMSKILMSLTKNNDDTQIAGFLANFEDEYKADAIFIDQGYGTGIYSAGKQMGRQWTLVNFGAGSNTNGYLNKRAEMWGAMRDWLKEGGAIPNDPLLCSEICAPEYEVKMTGLIKLESKDDMKKRGLGSPNRADALALTFAFPVQKKTGNRFADDQGEPQFCNTSYDLLAMELGS